MRRYIDARRAPRAPAAAKIGDGLIFGLTLAGGLRASNSKMQRGGAPEANSAAAKEPPASRSSSGCPAAGRGTMRFMVPPRRKIPGGNSQRNGNFCNDSEVMGDFES